MKFSTINVLAFAVPALSAAIGNVSLAFDALDKREFDAVALFPKMVHCPSTPGEPEARSFDQHQMEATARLWLNQLNDRKSAPPERVGGYPARYALGKEGAPNEAGWFAENTKRMQFTTECKDAYMWEVPMLASGNPWTPGIDNGQPGGYRLYFTAMGGTAKWCGSAVHYYPKQEMSKDPEVRRKDSVFSRCVPEN
ncbi:uncharacterized protein PG986_002925 [Apiospora aurea]|uniref:Uncharacterized protein n=1 Tax=Apiospora aurea TaxID=335848 RepID=A0ABR1QQ81_9PEZI